MNWQPVTGGPPHSIPATVPKAFHEEPGCMLSRGQHNMCRRLWHTPKISRKFSGEWKLSSVLRPGRKPHWVSSSFGSIISRDIFSRHLAYISREAKERYTTAVSTFTPVSLFVYGDDHSFRQSFGALPEHQATWHIHLDILLYIFIKSLAALNNTF